MWRIICWFPILTCLLRLGCLLIFYTDTPYAYYIRGLDYKELVKKLYK